MFEEQPNCIFCSIIATNDENVILVQNDDLVVIKDIKPASQYHFLVISKKHISDCKCLSKDDETLVKDMSENAKSILAKNNVDMLDSSISHLHLHAIAPASRMSFFGKIIFKANTWWCVTPEYVLDRISKCK